MNGLIQYRLEMFYLNRSELVRTKSLFPETLGMDLRIKRYLSMPPGIYKFSYFLFMAHMASGYLHKDKQCIKAIKEYEGLGLLVHKKGVFIGGARKKISVYEKEIDHYGLIDAQGLVNHVHFKELGISNRFLQFALSIRIIEVIIKRLKKGKHKLNLVVYVNGPAYLTFCLYGVAGDEEDMLQQLDERLKIRDIYISLRPW